MGVTTPGRRTAATSSATSRQKFSNPVAASLTDNAAPRT